MGILRVLDKSGDTVTTWDVASVEETEHARKVFEDGMREHRSAYRLDPGREEVIRKFDPLAEEIELAVPLQGG